ncbi:MAG: hypothetical protein ACHQIG_09070 [Acidimicrobiia bacterium]
MDRRQLARRWCGLVLVAAIVSGLGMGIGAAYATSAPSVPKKARMVCAAEAKRDIAGVLAIEPDTISTPTWADHVYSCTYQYPTGSFTVSVAALASRATTTSYFRALGTRLDRLPDAVGLGDGAFATPDGSVVVRKDNDVLEVDVSKMPPSFGKLALSPGDVASTVAVTILGCWKG